MKPACVKARVARKSRGQQCPYGFDSRPKHSKSLLEISLRGIFCLCAILRHELMLSLIKRQKDRNMKRHRTKEEFESAVRQSLSIAGVCRYLGLKPSGGNYKIIHNALKEYSIDTSHFTGQGWNRGLAFKPFKETPLSAILTQGSSYQSYKLKNRLLKEGIKENICESCKLQTWMGRTIPLELHHINGDNTDNRIENLLLLCPNCHALTSSYRGKNKHKDNCTKCRSL